MNIFQFAIMLVALLFGGHSALDRWDIRSTRRAMMRRACKYPDFVARAWVESQGAGKSPSKFPKLWLQFSGGKPYAVAQGGIRCAKAIARLRSVGITVDTSAAPEVDAPLD